MTRIFVGTSGWAYRHWRGGAYYPVGLRQRDELAFIASRVSSVELNGSFYSLQRPESYQAWHDATPPGFVFAVKGSRFITHIKKLRDVETALANFFASGVLALEEKLGPIVWQLPADLRFDQDKVERFIARLPRDTVAASALAREHDVRVAGRSWTETEMRRPVRHALEPRNVEFVTPACIDLLRHHDVALVTADSGRWPRFEEVTASFVYLRLHGSPVTYASRYDDEALGRWAEKIRAWRRGSQPADARRVTERPLPSRRARDVYVYFDNDGHAHAPHDAERLARLLDLPEPSSERARLDASVVRRTRPAKR